MIMINKISVHIKTNKHDKTNNISYSKSMNLTNLSYYKSMKEIQRFKIQIQKNNTRDSILNH